LPSGTPIRIAGLTVARQRPASAKGVVFLLLEDEHGLVNLVLFREVYEQHRLLARTEPLLEAYGKLERRERNINVIVERLLPLGTPSRRVLPTAGLQPVGSAQIFEELPMAAGDEVRRLRANAPGAHHFGQGRGRR
jgi:error-prone DNA polymerase